MLIRIASIYLFTIFLFHTTPLKAGDTDPPSMTSSTESNTNRNYGTITTTNSVRGNWYRQVGNTFEYGYFENYPCLDSVIRWLQHSRVLALICWNRKCLVSTAISIFVLAAIGTITYFVESRAWSNQTTTTEQPRLPGLSFGWTINATSNQVTYTSIQETFVSSHYFVYPSQAQYPLSYAFLCNNEEDADQPYCLHSVNQATLNSNRQLAKLEKYLKDGAPELTDSSLLLPTEWSQWFTGNETQTAYLCLKHRKVESCPISQSAQ